MRNIRAASTWRSLCSMPPKPFPKSGDPTLSSFFSFALFISFLVCRHTATSLFLIKYIQLLSNTTLNTSLDTRQSFAFPPLNSFFYCTPNLWHKITLAQRYVCTAVCTATSCCVYDQYLLICFSLWEIVSCSQLLSCVGQVHLYVSSL